MQLRLNKYYFIVFNLLTLVLHAQVNNTLYHQASYVKLVAKKVYTRDNFEKVGNNEFVFNFKTLKDQPDTIYLIKFPSTTPAPYVFTHDLKECPFKYPSEIFYSIDALGSSFDFLKWTTLNANVFNDDYFTNDELSVNVSAFENDCGGATTYNDCCRYLAGACVEDDNGLGSVDLIFKLQDYPSNTVIELEREFAGGRYKVVFELLWYPINTPALEFHDPILNQNYPCYDYNSNSYNYNLLAHQFSTSNADKNISYRYEYLLSNVISNQLDDIIANPVISWTPLPTYGPNNTSVVAPDVEAIMAEYPQYKQLSVAYRYQRVCLNGPIKNDAWSSLLAGQLVQKPNNYRGAPQITTPTCAGKSDGSVKFLLNNFDIFYTPKETSIKALRCNSSDLQTCKNNLPMLGDFNSPDESYFTPFDNNQYEIVTTDTTFRNLPAGHYVFQFNDPQGVILCPNVKWITINEPQPLTVAASEKLYTNTNVSCRDVRDGEVTLTISGGTKPYKVSADSSTAFDNWQVLSNTANAYTYTGLRPDSTYYFGISDKNNCNASSNNGDGTSVPVYNYLSKKVGVDRTLTNPDTLRFNFIALKTYNSDLIYNTAWHVSCKNFDDGELSALTDCQRDESKINPNFKMWMTGTNTQGQAIYKTIQTTSNSSKSIDNSPIIFDTLFAGDYRIYLEDNNGCQTYFDTTLVEPPLLTIDLIDSSQVKCFGGNEGKVLLNAIGGTRPYYYTKDSINQNRLNAKPYYLCFGDQFAEGCNLPHNENVDTYDTAVTLSELQFGLHTFKIRDANNCRAQVNNTITQPEPLSIDFELKGVSCVGESDADVKAIITGGTKPYGNFLWKDPYNETIAIVDSVNDVTAGNYRFSSLDANRCAGIGSIDITQPEKPLSAKAAIQQEISCADNADAVIQFYEIEGGWPERAYSIDGQNYYNDRMIFTGLASGTYEQLKVKDKGGCIIDLPAIAIENPGALTVRATTTAMVDCYDSNNGTVTFEVTGGNAPYAYTYLNRKTNIVGNHFTIEGLSAGLSQVIVSDANNCSLVHRFEVGRPNALLDSIYTINHTTSGMSEGNVSIQGIGGTPPYNYALNTVTVNSKYQPVTFLNLASGYHQINITDAKGCAYTSYVGINDIGGPTMLSQNVVAVSCSYTKDGQIAVAYDGTAPISYNWEEGFTGGNLSNLAKGVYHLTVTDAAGLKTTQAITVNAPDSLIAMIQSFDPICHNECTGKMQALINGGTMPYEINWSNGAHTEALENLCAATYQLSVTDQNNCEAVNTTELLNPSPVAIPFEESAVICTGQNYTIDAGNPGSTYSWTSTTGYTSTSQEVVVATPGIYTVDLISPYGCKASKSFELQNSSELLQAEFLLPSKNYVGDTVVLVDISWPRPEKIEWLYSDSGEVVKKANTELQLIYETPGYYQVGMMAFLGQCKDTMYKTVKIYEVNDSIGFANGRVVSSNIKDLQLYPNPNDGQFYLTLSLNHEAPVELHLFDVYGLLIDKKSITNQTEATVYYYLNQLAQGNYLLKVLCEGEIRTIMVTIQ